jgi:hypothetical protein
MAFLSDDDIATLLPSELVSERTPIPRQIVSGDECFPAAQKNAALPMSDRFAESKRQYEAAGPVRSNLR